MERRTSECAEVEHLGGDTYQLTYKRLYIEVHLHSEEEAREFCESNGVGFKHRARTSLEGGKRGEVPGADAGVHEGVSEKEA